MDLTSAGIGGAMATGVFTIFGWLLRRSIAQNDRKIEAHDDALKELNKALDAHRLHVAENYVNNSALEKAIDAFNRSIDAVFAKLDRIESKLDTKADKP